MDHVVWMQHALALARKGAATVAPNPMVGAVLVCDGRVLAEGWHRKTGAPHAEVECLRAFGEGMVPKDAVMYVTLEPCAHHGLTPPCADLLIARGLEQVVVGCNDPNPLVAGQGIARMRDAGIAVKTDLLRDECRWTNRRFITSFEQGRPYIILKWAQSSDGFLDQHPRTGRGVQRISSLGTDVLVHQWRSEEQAIVVGSRTVLNDDPQLTVRHITGRDPLRVVIDRQGTTPGDAKVYDATAPTLLVTSSARDNVRAQQLIIAPATDPIDAVLAELQRWKIRSLLVEGGTELHTHFIGRGLWDEARVITGETIFGNGTKAPELSGAPQRSVTSGPDLIEFHSRLHTVPSTWVW